MSKPINPLDLLRTLEKQHGSLKALAAALGYSAPYLSDVLRGRRNVTEKLLGKLGAKRIVVRA